jgi:hypothetical protein
MYVCTIREDVDEVTCAVCAACKLEIREIFTAFSTYKPERLKMYTTVAVYPAQSVGAGGRGVRW